MGSISPPALFTPGGNELTRCCCHDAHLFSISVGSLRISDAWEILVREIERGSAGWDSTVEGLWESLNSVFNVSTDPFLRKPECEEFVR